MVQMMDQAWESLLKCSLKPNPGNAQDVDSIVSAIDSTYSKTTSGFSTTAQSEFKKLFVEIVCTAFTVCTTVPTKNPPRFGAHKKVRTKKNWMSSYTQIQAQYNTLRNKVEIQIEVL